MVIEMTVELKKSKYWCSSCPAMTNTFIVTIRFDEENGTSFILCNDCINKLDKLIEHRFDEE